MRYIFGLIVLNVAMSLPAFSAPITLVDVSHQDKEVLVESAQLKSAVIKENTYNNTQVRSLVLTLELNLMGTGCNIVDGYMMRLQAPNSYKVKIATHDKPDCLTIGTIKSIGTGIITVTFEQFDSRSASEAGKPWPKFDWSSRSKSPIEYYTFTNSSYFQGYEILKLFKLDLTDVENVRFELYKTISYSADQVVEHE